MPLSSKEKERITQIFERFAAHNPTPKGELDWTNPFTLLVAVVMSAQATDVGVNKATPALFALADNPEAMVKLGEERIADLIKSINYYRTKAKNILGLSQRLIDDFRGDVPSNREALESLPGVGRKTANVVLNIAFERATIPVDTHIGRVAQRLKLTSQKTPPKIEADLEHNIPARYLPHAHHWLILHGRYICKARKPLCPRCPIIDLCPWEPKTTE